jgi:hypothetical protein
VAQIAERLKVAHRRFTSIFLARARQSTKAHRRRCRAD